MPDESRSPNRLSHESSPYLLQHQFNPVDWRPWGVDAFEAARTQNRPILLSVGYSTCYWCHVMERESFENEEVAAEMNKRFICIKVDREERPDVDQLYMTALQVLTRHGGWPMNIFLTPDLRPFFGGTYFPPSDMGGRPGFVTILDAIDDAWRHRHEQVHASAEQLTSVLSQLAHPASPESSFTIDSSFIDDLVRRSTDDFDHRNGGFGTAPKFPRQTLIELMLVLCDSPHHSPTADHCRSMIVASLDAMARGGIHDHLGGGFHRYSTDAKWLVPHFEIMLYDNAMLAWLYAEAYRQFQLPRHAAVARGILDFVLHDMTSPEGVFYTAFDAEAEGREGRPYLWTRRDVEEILKSSSQGVAFTSDDVALFLHCYGLDQSPNFDDPHHPSAVPDQYVLHLPQSLAEVAKGKDLSVDQLERRLAPMRSKLLAARRRRVQPLLDTKILTSWNALTIRALAHAGKVLGERRYVEAAVRASTWLLEHHVRPDGTLLHATRPDHPGRQTPGFLDDYAAMLLVLSELDATGSKVLELKAQMLARFASSDGGFYFTDRNADDLIVRQMVASDSPVPSGNGLAASALLRLGEKEQVRATLMAFAESLRRQGEGMSSLLQAALQWVRQCGPLPVAAQDKPISHGRTTDTPPVVDLSARWTSATSLEARVNIAPGYHLNAHDAADGLIPTTLRVIHPHDAAVAGMDYPAGALHGRAVITVRFATPPDPRGQPLQLALSYQPCTDKACLAPAVARVSISGV